MESHHLAKITLYSHHFSVTCMNSKVREIMLSYCRTLGQYGLVKVGRRKFVKSIVKIFAAATKDRKEFRFHINTYDEFMRYVTDRGIPSKQLYIEKRPLFEPAEVNCDFIDERSLFDYQEPIVDYNVDEGKSKLVPLDPGLGKTFISLYSINELNYRSMFVIRAQYIEKWISDIKESYNVGDKDLMVVQGTSSFKKFLEICEAGELEASFIICSNQTYRMFLKQYETLGRDFKDYGFALHPHEVLEAAKVGLRLIDEVHQDFHFNYRQDLYSHVPLTISLSGSVESDDKEVARFTEIMFPTKERYRKPVRKVYASAEALFYSMPEVDEKVRYINPAMKSYSHVLFEKSIMKRKKLQKSYFSMIADLVEKRFIDIREEGQKIIVFMSTIEMCTRFADYLKTLYPDRKVQRYVGEDDYETMLGSEIIVSTLKSLGTAIDVPDLRIVLLTEAIGSSQSNIQCFGRLRSLKKWPETSPEFLFLVNGDIDKHLKYYTTKREILKNRVISFKSTRTDYVV